MLNSLIENSLIEKNKSASALVSPDKQIIFGKKSPTFDFYCRRLFDLEGLGAGAGRRLTSFKIIHKVSFYHFLADKKAAHHRLLFITLRIIHHDGHFHVGRHSFRHDGCGLLHQNPNLSRFFLKAILRYSPHRPFLESQFHFSWPQQAFLYPRQ